MQTTFFDSDVVSGSLGMAMIVHGITMSSFDSSYFIFLFFPFFSSQVGGRGRTRNGMKDDTQVQYHDVTQNKIMGTTEDVIWILLLSLFSSLTHG
jgi:hypothetical protein